MHLEEQLQALLTVKQQKLFMNQHTRFQAQQSQ